MSGIASSSQSQFRALIPLWLQGKWGSLGIVFIAYTLLNLAWTLFHWGGPQRVMLISNLLSIPPDLLAALLAWRAAAEGSPGSLKRRAWFLLGLSCLMLMVGNIIWTYVEVVLQLEPFPSLADVFYVVFYPFALWGLLSLPGAPQTRRERLSLWFDLASVLIAATMFVGYFIIVPTAAGSSDLLTRLIAAAYPIGSLLLIGGILALLYGRPAPNTQSALSLLLIGMVFFVGSDLAFGYTSLIGTYTAGGWTDACWNVAQLFFALAALRSVVHSAGSPALRRWIAFRDRYKRWLSPMAIAMAYGLVFYTLLIKQGEAAGWLTAAALLLTLFIISRQIVSPAFADFPIRVKVILTFIVVSVLSVCLVAATAYFTIHSNLQSLAGHNLKAEVELRAQTLGNELSKQLDLLEGFALGETIENGASRANASYFVDPSVIEAQLKARERDWKAALDTDPLVQRVLHNSMAQELDDFGEKFPDHMALLLTDRYGAVLAATTRPAEYSYSAKLWWQAAFNDGQGAVYISQPAFDPVTREFQVEMAVPVRTDHGQAVIGILHTTFRIQAILELLFPLRSETQTGFKLLLPDGTLFNAKGLSRVLSPEIMASLQARQKEPYIRMDFEGITQTLSQAPLNTTDQQRSAVLSKLNWMIVANEKPSITLAPLHAAWRAALLAMLVVMFLTSGVAMILAQILIAPISRLTSVAARIAAGDFTTQAQVESRDEVGTLATTFNTMLATLSHTQEELREREELYRSLVDYSPDMIAVQSSDRLSFVNPAGVKLLSAASADELIGKRLLEIIPEDERELIQQSIEYVTISGEATSLQYRKMQRLDRTLFEAEYRAIPIIHAGQPAIQLVVRDITERKKAQEQIHQLLAQVARQRGELEIRVEERTAELNTLNRRLQIELAERQQLMVSLRESEERFRLLFDASPDAIFLIDPHDPVTIYPIVDCNQAAARMNGYAREELIGQSVDMLNLKKGTRQEFAEILEKLRREVVVRGVEASHRHRDGHIFPIEYSTTLIRVGERELILGIDRDITERKRVEEELRQAKEMAEAASRAKSEFLSRMSHELRTPMNAILGFAQLLEMSRKEPLTSTQKERVKQIVKGGQHLLDLINEILDIARIEANRLPVSPEPVSVRDSIQDAVDLTMPLAVKRQIQIVTDFNSIDANSYVLADRQRLKQVLLNLLGNAVKYNYEGGSVMIACERSAAPGWRISIADSGPGITAEGLRRLFTPFERLGADQPNVEGTGLGLVLAKRLVELMRGQIGVESIVGAGSSFWIELPAAESPVERLQRGGGTGELPSLPAAARTILYVEDNVANFELIKQVLADYSQIDLLWAADLRTGMELACARQPSLILLDLHLGGRDGAEILQQLKRDKATGHIPVIVVSADATPGQIERLKSWGAHAYLTKPLDVKHFIGLIQELLAEET